MPRGRNRIENNVGHQVSVAAGATAFLGFDNGSGTTTGSTGDENVIHAGPQTAATSRLVYNRYSAGATVYAQGNDWGATTPVAPASWFCTAWTTVSAAAPECGPVNYDHEFVGWLPALTAEGQGAGLDGEGHGAPAVLSRAPGVTLDTRTARELLAEARRATGETARPAPAWTAPATAGKAIWSPEELAARMAALRASVESPATEADTAVAHMRELHGLAFVDGDDALGVRAANWQAIGSGVASLGDPSAGAADRSVLADGLLGPGAHALSVAAGSLPAGSYVVRAVVAGDAGASERLVRRLTVVR